MTRSYASDSAIARRGEGDNITNGLEMELCPFIIVIAEIEDRGHPGFVTKMDAISLHQSLITRAAISGWQTRYQVLIDQPYRQKIKSALTWQLKIYP